MSRTLLFLEFPEHVEEALAGLPGGGDPTSPIIALTPHVAASLRARDVRFAYPEDFFEWRALEQQGDALDGRRDRIAARIDTLLGERISEFAASGFRPARLATYELTVLLGNVWSKLYRILAVLDALRPDRVTFYGGPLADRADTLHFPHESLYGHLIAVAGSVRDIATEARPLAIAGPFSWADHGATPPFPPLPSTRLAAYGKRIADRARPWLRFLRPGDPADLPRVLVLQTPVPLTRFRGKAEVTYWPEDEATPADRPAADPVAGLEASLLAAFEALEADAELRGTFVEDGIDWYPVVAARLRHLFSTVTARAFRQYLAAKALVEHDHPEAVVVTNASSQHIHARCLAARQAGLPVICEQHGPSGSYYARYDGVFDMIGTTDYVVCGAKTAEYMERYFPRAATYRFAGSPMMEEAARPGFERAAALRLLGLDPARPAALYMLAPVAWNLDYPPYRLRDDRRSYDLQVRALDALLAHPELQIVLKGHPATDYPVTPLKAYADARAPGRTAYVAAWPFRQMLDMAEFFVLDYPATTLFQVLTRNKPVYGFADFYPFLPECLELLPDWAVLERDPEALLARLAADLASGAAFRRGGRADRFLDAYVDPFRDGKAEQRLVDIVVEIARGARQQRALSAVHFVHPASKPLRASP